jgi:6-pyruvoyl-tetrahydropterin synthase
VLKPFQNADINRLPAFAQLNPSAERIVEVIYRAIEPQLPRRVKLAKVTITEAPGCRASFSL